MAVRVLVLQQLAVAAGGGEFSDVEILEFRGETTQQQITGCTSHQPPVGE
jgi:hypothetical protein